MFKAEFYDSKSGFFKLFEFKSLALLLARAKKDDKHVIRVFNGKETLLCRLNLKQGWIIEKAI